MNEELLWYAESHTTPESHLLAKLNRETHLSQIYPRMLAGHVQGTFLRMVSQMIRPVRVLEIGTFTGYSAICFAEGAEKVHTIEVDPELEELIRRYLMEAGVDKRVDLHIGDASEIIPTIDEQWDLVYIDADKPNYLNYYHLVFDRVRPGGFILADNTLWGGKVLETKSKNKDVIGIREFNDFVQQDERVENLLLPLRDGIMMARKR